MYMLGKRRARTLRLKLWADLSDPVRMMRCANSGACGAAAGALLHAEAVPYLMWIPSVAQVGRSSTDLHQQVSRTQTRLHGFRWSLHCILTPLSGASARALVVTPSFSRPMWLRYAPVRRGAAAISSHIALNVWLCCPRRRPLSCDEHQHDLRPCHAAAPLATAVI